MFPRTAYSTALSAVSCIGREVLSCAAACRQTARPPHSRISALFFTGMDFLSPRLLGNSQKPSEFGLGVQYHLNDYTTMGLNYMHVKTDLNGVDNDNVVRFRTKVTF